MNNANRRQKAALIATLGTEPQVVTTVLNLLMLLGENINKEIFIRTTSRKSPNINAIEYLKPAFSKTKYLREAFTSRNQDRK